MRRVALLVLIGLATPARAEEPASEFDRVVVNPPDGLSVNAVVVENSLGSVQVEGHDRPDLVVEARKRAPDDSTVKRLTVAVSPRANGVLHVGTTLEAGTEMRPIAAGSVGIDLAIKIPRGARPDISIWKGKVVISGLDNGAVVQANQAEVDMRNMSGDISSHIAAGRQQFAEISNTTLLASTLDGDMALDLVSGQVLDAWAHTGDLSAQRVRFREIALRTLRGDIRVRAQLLAGGRYQISSFQGDVEIALESVGPVRVTTVAEGGRISLPDDVRAGVMTPEYENGSFFIEGRGKRLKPAEVRLYSKRGDVRVDTVRVLGVRTTW